MPGKMHGFFAWIKDHRDTVIGSLVMLAAAAILGIWVALHHAGLRETAWKNLFIAQQTGYSGNFTEAAKQLNSIENNFGRTSAWGFAVLTQGDLLFRQNKFKEAADEYAKIVAKGGNNLMPFALYDLGKAKEAAEDLPGAQTQYKNFLAAYPDHFLAPEVHYSLANCYELSKNAAEAKAAYEKIILLYPETSWAATAKAKTSPEQKDLKQPAGAVTKAPAGPQTQTAKPTAR
jgi:tetratricopeptide (TPR) repeat protein